MSNTERLEKYLEGITPPAYRSEEHYTRLRGRVLNQLASKDSGLLGKRGWRVVALVGGLLCAGALVAQVSVQVQRYLFQGRTRDGSYQFSSPLQTLYVGNVQSPTGLASMTVVQKRTTTVGAEESGSGNVEQMQKDLAEMDALKQQGTREVIGVTDTEVNGHPLGRVLEFKYVLADGRVKTMREAESDSNLPSQIEQEQQEIAKLRQSGQREITTILDTEVGGNIHRTLLCSYLLTDGRKMIVGEGDPTSTNSVRVLSESQSDELEKLKEQKAGVSMEPTQKQLFGQDFTFRRQAYTLADGTVVICSEGQTTGAKRNLSGENWDELANLRKAGKGQLIGDYEQEIQGKVFSFEKRKYVLSDGTEVVRANGVPKPSN